jgi:hypothetical protein
MFHVANEKSHHAPTRGPLRGGRGFFGVFLLVPNVFPICSQRVSTPLTLKSLEKRWPPKSLERNVSEAVAILMRFEPPIVSESYDPK